MKAVPAATEIFHAEFARFTQTVGRSAPIWVHELRRAAVSRFAELGFPTAQDEEWRHTNVTPIAETPFKLAGREPGMPSADELHSATSWPEAASRLIIMNGRFSPVDSSLRALPPGVKLGSLANALAADPGLVKPHLGRHAEYKDDPFVALNTAFLNDGVFVYLPPDAVIDDPLHVLFVSRSERDSTMSHPRTLIVAGARSRMTVIQSYVGWRNDRYFTNAVTELVLDEEAVLEHYLLQDESKAAFHISAIAIHQGRSSTYTSHSLATGAALARSVINGKLADEGATCTLRGLYAATGWQHLATHTKIDHAKPRCGSQQLYKGILDGHASAVFHGGILVRQDAQKTDARQTNNNLLLSEDAMVHTTPQLEIFAHDIACAHAATVGQLDPDALFYLRTRGIDARAARSLLTYAFGSEPFDLIQDTPFRLHLTELLAQWIAHAHEDLGHL